MKNKKFMGISTICLATAMASTCLLGGYKSLLKASATVADTVYIAVDEPLDETNLFTATKLTESTGAVFTMAYDTLLTMDSDGDLQPGLVDSWESSDATGSNEWDYVLPAYIENNWGSMMPPGWEKLPAYMESEQFMAQDGEECSDGTIYHLREDVRFYDGSYLTAQSIADLVAFAKTLPTDTLLYKQWSMVSRVQVFETYTFSFVLNLQNSKAGNMDFYYGLTTPMGSIVSVDGLTQNALPEFAMGTGAYKFNGSVNNNGVSLEKNLNWWNTANPVFTQNIVFNYVDSLAIIDRMAQEDYAVTLTRANLPTIAPLIEDTTNFVQYQSLPYALTFNFGNGIFSNGFARKAVALSIDKGTVYDLQTLQDYELVEDLGDTDNLEYLANLAQSSNGIWCYLTDKKEWNFPNLDESTMEEPDPAQKTTVIEWLWQQALNATDETLDEITLVALRDDCFASGSATGIYYRQMVDAIQSDLQENLDAILGEDSVTVRVIETTESGMWVCESLGNYDMMIKEIDYTNVNSAYNMLYGKISANANEMLTAVKYAINGDTFARLHAGVQWEALERTTLINLGWQKRVLIGNANVEGLNNPGERAFSPFGYMANVDLRWVRVEN